MRNSASVDEDNYARGKKKEPPASSGPQRSKTIMGRKLRVMTVEKGLLRETKAVHRMIDTLVECKVRSQDDRVDVFGLIYSVLLGRLGR